MCIELTHLKSEDPWTHQFLSRPSIQISDLNINHVDLHTTKSPTSTMLTIKLSFFYHVFLPKNENHFQGAKIVLSSLVGIWWQVAFTLPETNPANQYHDTYKCFVLYFGRAEHSFGPFKHGHFLVEFQPLFFLHLHSPKLTYPLRIDGWKMKFLLGPGLFPDAFAS